MSWKRQKANDEPVIYKCLTRAGRGDKMLGGGEGGHTEINVEVKKGRQWQRRWVRGKMGGL